MSFEDDAVEPLAVESAEHLLELLRQAAERGEPNALNERNHPRRALPRELGN